MSSEEREYALRAVALMRRAVLLTLLGKWSHARGQAAAARGDLALAGARNAR